MGGISIDNRTFSFKEIQESIPASLPDYASSAFHFCKEWLSGNEIFTLYTSGSTGQPKAIELTRQQMLASVLATAKALGLNADDRALVCLNTAYIAGVMMLTRGMTLDMNIRLVAPGSSPLRALSEKEKIDFSAFVPLQLNTMLEERNIEDIRHLQEMKAILVGGAAVSRELEEKIQFLSAPVYNTYGMTETVSHIALRRLNGKEKQPYYHTLPEVSIAVDERSCLKILSPVTKNEWLQTNDVVKILDENKFLWLGRADTIINSGGIKIQPEEIEKKLEKKIAEKGFSQFFIAGLPHSQLGEAVTLFLEGDKDKDPLFVENIKSMIEKFEVPKAIICLKTFPLTTTGKMDKVKMITEFKNYYLV
jgi:O-succinylbenzoic acid--CoA ligase